MPRGISRYDEALRQGRLWTPDQLRGRLYAWHDASRWTGTYATGVSQFDDRAFGAHPLLQATGSRQPTLTPGRSVDFSGDQRLNYSAAWGGASGVPSTFDVFVACRSLSSTAVWRTLLCAASSNHLVLIEQGTNWLGMYNGAFVNSGFTLAPSTYAIIHARAPTSNTDQISLNGAALTASLGTVVTAFNFVGNNSTVGQLQAFGSIYEIFVSGILDENTRHRAIGYLAWKWTSMGFGNHVANLSIASPYKTYPPLIGA